MAWCDECGSSSLVVDGCRAYVTWHDHDVRAVCVEYGPARTVFALTAGQAAQLARLITGEGQR